jgi:steroid delta-isomerase-like uncharacterized protein
MPEHNNAIVHRFEEAFAANDVATIDQLCAPNLVDHNPAPRPRTDSDRVQGNDRHVQSDLPESQVDVHAVIGEDDLVATHWTVTGTHRAEFFGVPATGRRVTVEGMNVYRLAGGKITDVWTQFDGLGLRQQLGALPS